MRTFFLNKRERSLDIPLVVKIKNTRIRRQIKPFMSHRPRQPTRFNRTGDMKIIRAIPDGI
jgi:hypothetical protein